MMRAFFATIASFGVVAALSAGAGCGSFSASDDEATTSDASSNDVTSIEDAAKTGDARASCPPKAFCDDFERDATPGQGWTDQVDTDGELSLVPDDRSAGGHALRVFIPANTADGRRAFLRHQFTVPSPRARLAFSFRVTQKPDDDFIVAQLVTTDQTLVFMMLRDDKLFVTEQSGLPDGGDNEDRQVGGILGLTWHRVVVTFVGGAPPTLSASLDDGPATTLPVLYALGPLTGAEIGSTYSRSGGDAAVLLDDVVIEDTF